MKTAYLTFIGTFALFSILVAWSPGFDKFISILQTNVNGLTGLRQPDLIYLVALLATPLWIFASALGLILSLGSAKRDSKARVLLTLFVPLLLMQIADILTFAGVIRSNHEIYYLRMYPPFISIAFGYAIWMKWIDRERVAEASERAGQIASAVAHDLRPPLAVLKVLSDTQSQVDQEWRDMLSGAVQSIDKISSSLLNIYRSSLVGQSECTIRRYN